MKTEFEAKFYPINKDEIREGLENIGAKLIHPETLMPLVQFTNWTNGFTDIHYLRVRDEFGKIKFAAKRHARKDGGIDDQKELQVEVSDFQTVVDILESAGLKGDYYQEKYREVWGLDGAEIVIDTCPELKPYIEIEAGSEQAVRDVASKLGFSWTDAIFTSTLEIYMKEHNMSKEDVIKRFKNWRFA